MIRDYIVLIVLAGGRYQGGDRGGGRGGGGGSRSAGRGSGRDGDWLCPNSRFILSRILKCQGLSFVISFSFFEISLQNLYSAVVVVT